LGLKVDRVVVQGTDKSMFDLKNRRFFYEPRKIPEITAINVCLIHIFPITLTVISSGHEINYERFDDYADRSMSDLTRINY